jgi:glucose-6-phosphate-specific signal transduction histidine kinase
LATLVNVRLVARGAVVHLLIEDDGVGLDGAGPHAGEPGVGVEGMAARVADLGGRFSLRRIGTGCRMLASIPTPAFRTGAAAV